VKAKKLTTKIFIGCIVALILSWVVFFMPLPFINALWEENILRHRMAWDISRRVIGLHEDEIILILGEPEPYWETFIYPLRNPNHSSSFRHLIIFFDEDGFARLIGDGHPYHWGVFLEHDALKEHSIFSSFQAILRNEQQLYFDSWGLMYLEEFPYGFRDTTELAVFDMDGSGVPEIIIAAGETQLIYLVLHYYDSDIFGHAFMFRSMGDIKTDGTFSNSFGETQGIARLHFIGNTFEYKFAHQFQGVGVSDEDILWSNAQNAKKDITWHPLSDESIQNLAQLITPRNMPLDDEIIHEAEYTESITVTRIHPNMPEFTFYHINEGIIIEDEWGFECYITHIVIMDEYENFIQKIDNINVSLWHFYNITQLVQFEDYNFDGYLDMRVLYDGSLGLGFPWEASLFWLWDPEIYQFVPNEQLREITRYTLHHVDSESRQLIMGWHTRAGAHSFTRYYEYANNDFIPVTEVEVEIFGRTGRGHFYGMKRTIHSDFITSEVTVSLNNLTESLTDAETEAIANDITERKQWIRERLEYATYSEFSSVPWIHEQPRELTFESEIYIKSYFYNGDLIFRDAWLEYDPKIGGGISFRWYYSENGDLLFADVFQYRNHSYLIYFYDDSVIRLIPGELGNEPVTDFDMLMINAIALSLENAYR